MSDDRRQPVILVTGAMGCVGAWALYHLVQRGLTAVSFDLSDNRSRLDLLLSRDEQQAITFVQGDLTDYAQVNAAFQTYHITHVIHLAALQVPFCRANPVLGAQVNVVGTVNIFEAARQNGVRHIAHASSVAIYGPAERYPTGLIAPDAPPDPTTLYGVYKVADEGIARVYWQDYGVSSIGLRPYTIYGLGRDQGLTSEPTKAMLAAAARRSYHISFGGVMQFQYASDVAQQFIDAALMPADGAPVFNLGGPPTPVETVADIIRRLRPGVEITVGDQQLPFPTGFDDTPLRQQFATVYETPLEVGIEQTLNRFERALREGLLA